MNILFKILPQPLPAWIRKRILVALFAVTADAFGSPAPALAHLSCDECLRIYALFTREQAERALQSRDRAAVQAALYANARPLGEALRTWFGVGATAEVMLLAQTLYGAIGVELQGDAQGNVTVSRCYFSHVYSSPVCDLISALDDGLFSGLSRGGRLVFSARLTEGCACCRANLRVRQ